MRPSFHGVDLCDSSVEPGLSVPSGRVGWGMDPVHSASSGPAGSEGSFKSVPPGPSSRTSGIGWGTDPDLVFASSAMNLPFSDVNSTRRLCPALGEAPDSSFGSYCPAFGAKRQKSSPNTAAKIARSGPSRFGAVTRGRHERPPRLIGHIRIRSVRRGRGRRLSVKLKCRTGRGRYGHGPAYGGDSIEGARAARR